MSKLLILDLIDCVDYNDNGRYRIFTFDKKSQEVLNNVALSMYEREHNYLLVEHHKPQCVYLSYLTDTSEYDLEQIRLPFDYSRIISVNEENGFKPGMFFSTFALQSINTDEWTEGL